MPNRKHGKRKSNTEGLNSTTIPLKSGFTVCIRPLPPYYKDLINDTIPLPAYPTRTITLAAGDEIDWPYESDEGHFDSEHEDYELYVRWKSVDVERTERIEIRNRARMDFLLSSCVDVVDGPYGVEDVEWAQKVEAAFEDWTVPTHPGRRHLVFLKTQVITDADDMDMVVRLSTAAEATMQGILTALRGFQPDLGQRGLGEDIEHLAEKQGVT